MSIKALVKNQKNAIPMMSGEKKTAKEKLLGGHDIEETYLKWKRENPMSSGNNEKNEQGRPAEQTAVLNQLRQFFNGIRNLDGVTITDPAIALDVDELKITAVHWLEDGETVTQELICEPGSWALMRIDATLPPIPQRFKGVSKIGTRESDK